MMNRLRAFEEKGDLREMGSLLAERFDEYVGEQVAKGVAEGVAKRLEEGFAEGFEEGFEEGFAKGFEEGFAKGGRTMLLSVAARRYGARAAVELALLLDPGADRNRIEEIFAEMFEYPDGAGFLTRIRRPD